MREVVESKAAGRAGRYWLGLTVLCVAFVVYGAWLAQRLVTWTDESAYVHLGYLAASGQISLFQDEMTGSRMPLPFWVIGWSQVAFGRSLLAARLVSLGIGVAAVCLTAALGRRIAGDLGGLLAAAFLVSQGVIVGYLVTGTYHALAATILLGGLALMIMGRQPWLRIAAVMVLSLLFLTRTNLWPILPAAVVVLWLMARGWRERVWITLAVAGVPGAFFLWDARHLKILAYVPIARHFVRPLGYPLGWSLVDIPTPAASERLVAVVRFGRTYEFWALALLVLVGLLVVCWRRGRPIRAFLGDNRARLVAAGIVYITFFQVLILWEFPKAIVAWFPSYAPLVAVLLGAGFALVLRDGGWRSGGRLVIGAALVLLMAAPAVVVRHPLLPGGVDAAARPMRDLAAAAAHMRVLVPPGARVFLLGDSLIPYLAGSTPFLQQIHSSETLAVVQERGGIERGGLWGDREMERWLAKDADYVVIEPMVVDRFAGRRPEQIVRFRALLAEHFDRIGAVDDYRWLVYDVYVRRSRTPRQIFLDGRASEVG
jgi:4-amino-4-deoxy-L-arabinose transferase-like glycosyltransferase